MERQLLRSAAPAVLPPPRSHHAHVPAVRVEQGREARVLERLRGVQRGDLVAVEMTEKGVQVGDGEAELQEVVTAARLRGGQVGRGPDGEVEAAELAGVVLVPAAVLLLLQ